MQDWIAAFQEVEHNILTSHKEVRRFKTSEIMVVLVSGLLASCPLWNNFGVPQIHHSLLSGFNGQRNEDE